MIKRRTFLGISSGLGAVGSLSVGPLPATGTNDPSGSITIQEQTSDGTSIVIAEISTEIDAKIFVINSDTEELIDNSYEIASGTYEEYEIELSPPLTDSAELIVGLFPDGGGSGFAEDRAVVHVGDDIELVDEIEPTLIDADPAAGFEYPYYLYAPATLSNEEPKPLMVEPLNTGTATNDFDRHLEAGEQTIKGGTARKITEELGTPLLVPVFPRPMSNPVDWHHYVHHLDDTTMSIDEGPLERVDLQLLNMVDNAQDYLTNRGYPITTDGIVLDGFSASGTFVDRFTVLHPEEVISVTAGGLNGMALLPLDEFAGRELPYHVGISDVEQLTGKKPDLDALDETNQFLYMGAEDENDTIPYDDAWTDDDLRELAVDVYGHDMITQRFPTCQQAYLKAGIEAQFRIYPDVGHTDQPAHDDIVEFHRRSIHGEDVNEFGEDLGPSVRIGLSSRRASVGEEIEFDASDSIVVASAENVTYQWEFGDGSTATGETTTYTYKEDGTFTVTLTVTTGDGNEYQEATEIQVSSAEDDTTDEDDTADEIDTVDEEGATDEESPGFGISVALTGIGGAAYMLKRRLTDTETESM